MINLIPMAGGGNRFAQYLYRVSKPFIMAMNEPMLISAIRSFPSCCKYVFVCRSEHSNKLETLMKHLNIPHDIIVVDHLTEGQACTCLLAEEKIDKNEGVFIASCDYQMVYDEHKYEELMRDESIDIIIWTFKVGVIKKSNFNAFAYCITDGNKVLQIVEKETISNTPELDPAIVGSFTYKRAGLFSEGARRMIKKNIRVHGEFYVGTSINQLIELGYNVVAFEIDKFISFGTPFELELFYYWQEYFHELEDHPYVARYGYKKSSEHG